MFIGNANIFGLNPVGTPFTNEKSLLFDGVDERGDFGSVSWASMFSENVSGKYCISFWIKYLGDDGDVISDIHPSFNNYGIRIRIIAGQMYWRSSSGGAVGAEISSATTMVSGTWYHFLLDYDNTLGTENMAMYVNGIKESTANQTINNPTNYTGIHIMTRNNNTNYTNGNLKDVSIFGTSVRAEVTSIYNGGTPSDLNLLTNIPKHWWRMGDSAGDNETTIKDVGSASVLYDMPLINLESGDLVTDTP